MGDVEQTENKDGQRLAIETQGSGIVSKLKRGWTRKTAAFGSPKASDTILAVRRLGGPLNGSQGGRRGAAARNPSRRNSQASQNSRSLSLKQNGAAAFASAAKTMLQKAKSGKVKASRAGRRWRGAAGHDTVDRAMLLAPFVPRLLKDQLRGDPCDGLRLTGSPTHVCQVVARTIKPSMHQNIGALMIADVTGFTKLTEALSKRGSAGVELLTRCMNSYFSQVMDVVFDYEGDVTKFAGDSMIIAFYPTEEENATSKDGGLRRATRRCICCAHELISTLGFMRMLPNGEVVTQKKKRSSVVSSVVGVNEDRSNAESSSFAVASMQIMKLNAAFNTLKHSSMHNLKAYVQPGARHAHPRDPQGPSLRQPADAMTASLRPESSSPNCDSSSTIKNPSQRESQTSDAQSSSTWDGDVPLFSLPSAAMPRPIGEGSEKKNGNLETPTRQYSRFRLFVENLFKNLRSNWQDRSSNSSDSRSRRFMSRLFRVKETGAQSHSADERRGSEPVAPRTPRHSQIAGSENASGSRSRRLRTTVEEIRKKMANHTEAATEVLSSKLALKVMIGAGTYYFFRVGGQEEANETYVRGIPRFECFVGDKPRSPPLDKDGYRPVIQQIQAIEDFAEAGDVIVSSEAMKLSGNRFSYQKLSDGAAFRVLGTPSGEKMKISRNVLQAAQSRLFSLMPKNMLRKSLGIMRMHVLTSVRERVEAHQLDFINEVRRLTVLFLGFPSLCEERKRGSKHRETDEIGEVQAAMEAVQRTMRRWGGALLQFRCDEKGFLAICAYGLPGQNHSDNVSRAIQSGIAIAQNMKKQHGSRVTIGITTGDLLCACVGSRARYEYTVFGDAINLSARLMCKAKGGLGDILCDEVTFLSATGQAKYIALDPLPVKGKSETVTVFRVEPLPENGDRVNGKGKRSRRSAMRLPPIALRPLVGRDDVFQTLNSKIEDTIRGASTGGTILIEGEAGMGKTKLIYELQRSDFGGLRCMSHMFCASAYAANKSAILQPWRTIFKELFSIDQMMGKIEEGSKSVPFHGHQFVGDEKSSRRKRSSPEVHPTVTGMGQILGRHVEDFEDWREYLSETLSIPIESIPQAAPTLPRALSFTKAQRGKRNSYDAHKRVSCQTIPLSDRDRAILSLVSFLHTLRDSGQEHLPGPSKSQIQLPPGIDRPLRKAHSSSPVGASPVEKYDFGSEIEKFPRRLYSMDSVIPKEAEIFRDLPSDSTEETWTTPEVQTSHKSFYNPPWRKLPPLDLGSGKKMESLVSYEGFSPTNPGHFMETTLRSTSQDDVAAGGHQVTQELKTEMMLDILSKVVQSFACLYGPVVFIIENVQHMDTFSWRFMNKLSEEVSEGCLVVLTLRPNDGSLASSSAEVEGKQAVVTKIVQEYELLAKSPRTWVMQLEPLDVHSTRAFMEVIADGKVIPEDIVQAVLEKSSGVPMFVEQVTLYLAEKGMLGTSSMDLTTDHGLVDFIREKVSVHHVIVDQMDRLRPSAHLTLKVAAVMGTNITATTLMEVYPFPTSKENIEEDLEDLQEAGFLRQSITTPGSWQFTTMVARDIVYDLIPRTQQQQLHARLADVLASSDSEVPATTLAFHWSQSCLGEEIAEWRRAVMAVRAWEKAADEAAQKGALAESVRLYQKAADLAGTLSLFFEDGAQEDVAKHLLEPARSENSFSETNAYAASGLTSPVIPIPIRVSWERKMADMCYIMSSDSTRENASENRALSKKHVLTGLSYLGAPLPGDESTQSRRRSSIFRFFCACHCFRDEYEDSSSLLLDGEVLAHVTRFLEILYSLSIEVAIDDPMDMALFDYCRKVMEHFSGKVTVADGAFFDVGQKIETTREYLLAGGILTRKAPSSFSRYSLQY